MLRVQNILKSFDEFSGNDVINTADMQDYLSVYSDLHEEFKTKTVKDDVSDDVVFEMELVKQIVVNIDYIMMLVEEFTKENHQNKEIPINIVRAINSNPELRPKKELIEKFIATINSSVDINGSWIEFRDKEKELELAQIIAEEKLDASTTKSLIERIFHNGVFKISDAELSKIMPKMPRFGRGSMAARLEKKEKILERLNNFFLKYYD